MTTDKFREWLQTDHGMQGYATVSTAQVLAILDERDELRTVLSDLLEGIVDKEHVSARAFSNRLAAARRVLRLSHWP